MSSALPHSPEIEVDVRENPAHSRRSGAGCGRLPVPRLEPRTVTTIQTLDDLQLRIRSGYPVLWLRTYEEDRWELLLAELAEELEYGIVTWSMTEGASPAADGSDTTDLDEFLKSVHQYPVEHLFLLKDVHRNLDNPQVIRRVRDMLPHLVERRQSLLCIGAIEQIPIEWKKDVTLIELPLPNLDEMREELGQLLVSQFGHLTLDNRQEEHMAKAVLGLTAREARKAFSRSLQGREVVDDAVYVALVSEKRQMVQGADLLEFFDLEEGIEDIGGLEGLKEWMHQRAEAFSADARARGISYPKGLLLAGVQGCGKSLSAKAIARVLGFPLIRMDLANLLDSSRGVSEQNLREVLRLMETISPSVLWLEEIDKAFAGFDSEAGSDATVARLVGRFLTWLQEHTAPVFVVATANNISRLPPELLRRGRFDELFFVDLPNYYERQTIFAIHLKKRGWNPEKFSLGRLSDATEAYSGAEIETIVNSAIIETYSQGKMLTEDDLMTQQELLVPLSKTMEDQIFNLREWARTRCRPATPDSRVLKVMEEEERRGETETADGSRGKPQLKWIELAEHGQFAAAVVEYVRFHDNTRLDKLLADFEKYTPTAGEFGLVLKSNTKVVVWTRMSLQFADWLLDFIAKKLIFLNPTTAADFPAGNHPALPVLTDLPEGKVSNPHWMPFKLRLVPPPGGSANYSRVSRIRMGRG